MVSGGDQSIERHMKARLTDFKQVLRNIDKMLAVKDILRTMFKVPQKLLAVPE